MLKNHKVQAHYRPKSAVTFLLVTHGSPASLGIVHSSSCGPVPESNMMYKFPSPVALSLIAAKDRYVVFGFCRGWISDVPFKKPVVQFQALISRELRSGTAKTIRLARGVSTMHCGCALTL